MAVSPFASFLIDTSRGETPQSVAKKRADIAAMLGSQPAPRYAAEGLGRLLSSAVGAYKDKKLQEVEKAGQASGNEARSRIMQSLLGGFTGSEAQASTGAPSATGVDVAKRLQADFGLTPAAAAGFAGNLAHESGDFKTLQEINPMVPGSRGGYGWAQWTGPRRREFEAYAQANGLDPASPEANYGFLKSELQGREGGVLQSLRGVNDPASAARIISDKFFRPGIPNMGSRAAKAKQIAAMLSGNGAPQAQGAQVASLEPFAAMPPAQAQQAPSAPSPMQAPIVAQQGLPTAPFPIPTPRPPHASQVAPAQEAQAMPQNAQDVFPAAPQAPQAPAQGMDMQALMREAQNPWLDDQTRGFVNSLIEREMQKRDPAYQMQQQAAQIGLQKSQLELQRLQNPGARLENVGGRLVQIMPDGSVKEAYAPPPDPADQIQQQAAQIGLQKSQLELQQMQNPQPKLENIGGRLVQVNPDGSAKEVYAPPAPVTTEITDVNGKRVLVNKQTGEVVRELGESPSKQKDAPAGYQMNADGKTMSRIPGYRDTNLEMDMRKEFDTQTKDFRAVRDSYNRIQASAENPTPAGDLSLIFNYMKMLDPGSVVRESEFATASNAAPLLTRYGLDAEKLKGVWEGQRLTPEQRADFLNRSNQLYAEQDQTFQSLADQYSQAAARNGLDPNNIILTPRSNPRKKRAEPVTINGYQIEQVED